MAFVSLTGRTEQVVVDALRKQLPVKDLPGVSISGVQEQPEQPFDVSFELRSGPTLIQVLGEIKPTFSPRSLEQIAPWIQRLKSLRPDVVVAVIAPALSPPAQAFCIQSGVDFMDLAGNILVNVPGKLTLQRSGMRSRDMEVPALGGERAINVFSGRSSRVLRVLLEKPRASSLTIISRKLEAEASNLPVSRQGLWSVTMISRELARETARLRQMTPAAPLDFAISLGSVSKAVASLEDQLLVRRRGGDVLVPEPSRVLLEWAQKYKERYRWRLRSSFQTSNPFGGDLQGISSGIDRLAPGGYAFTGAMAASVEAPFVDVDTVDIFLMSREGDVKLRNLKSQVSVGPTLRFIYPYDDGVFMYSKQVGKALVVSGVQAYLDLYARGGRDLKQAEVLLSGSIQRRWGAA
jgi:hypothetical protein